MLKLKQDQFTWKMAPPNIQKTVLKFPVKGLSTNSAERASPLPFPEFSPFNRVIFTVPASYYAQKLGYFCRQELNLDRLTPVPIRFRLGSTEYVNWMEGKPNAIKPVH